MYTVNSHSAELVLQKGGTVSRATAKTASSEKLAAARERRNAQRNRLKEMKMAAARRAREEGSGEREGENGGQVEGVSLPKFPGFETYM